VLIYFELGSESAASYYAAYAIELSMSVDNLFVFMVIFAAFAIPFQDQHRVLFYGILGAIFLRLLFVEVGADLLETFDWMMYIFGAILIYTAVKTAFSKSEGKKTEDTLSYKLSKKINSTPDLRGAKFLVRENGKMLATPLLLCLIVIELSDIMFAFDSIPAALAISTDIFLVYTSNIFAVMGLRSMYFVIRDVLGNLRFLKYGLGVILMFIGLKMLLSAADICEVSTFASLAVIIIVLAVTVVASLASKNSSP
jgi:tellurite resistance protein TerC